MNPEKAVIPVYRCKCCDKFIVSGIMNEFQEAFCNKRHYKKYCRKNKYDIHMDKIYVFEITLH